MAFQDVRLEGAPFGVSPLYAAVVGGALRTASRASDLAERTSKPNVSRLAALLTSTPPLRREASLFDGVARIPSDGVAVVGPHDHIHFEPRARTLSPMANGEISAVDAADEIWRLLLASVRRSVAGATRVAVMTGGGVDSGALLAAAVAICRGASSAQVEAIALSFGGVGDDRPYLEHLENELGVVALRIAPRDCGRLMRPILDSSTLPVWSTSGAADQILLQAARDRGADVLLIGSGGDDIFDGFPRLLASEALGGNLHAFTTAARMRVPWPSSPLKRVSEFIARPLLARGIPSRIQRERRRAMFRRYWPWAGPAVVDFYERECERWTRPSFDTPRSRFDLIAKGDYLSDAIELMEELAARAKIRIAHPFLDVPLLELVCRLPPRLLFQGDRLRGLFRLAARGFLPSRVRLRPTKAFFANAHREILASAGGLRAFEDLATMERCAEIGLVDRARFRTAFASFERDTDADPSNWSILWPALGIEGFLRARATVCGAC